MTQTKLIFLLFITYSSISFGQTKDSILTAEETRTDNLNAETSLTCQRTYNWLGSYWRQCFFKNGKQQYIGKSHIYRVFRSKTWDEDGRLVRKSKIYPFNSTSYTKTTSNRTYGYNGKLIKYEFTKTYVSCFRGPKVLRQNIIEYDNDGNMTTWSKRNRKRIKCGRHGLL